MQDGGAYVQQIPPGAPAPPAAVIRPPPPGAGASATPPPGLYLQIAEASDQAEAAQASIAFIGRLKSDRPPFIRGVVVQSEGRRRIRMFAGPFADADTAHAFCSAAMPDAPCLLHRFDPGPTPASGGDRGARPVAR